MITANIDKVLEYINAARKIRGRKPLKKIQRGILLHTVHGIKGNFGFPNPVMASIPMYWNEDITSKSAAIVSKDSQKFADIWGTSVNKITDSLHIVRLPDEIIDFLKKWENGEYPQFIEYERE